MAKSFYSHLIILLLVALSTDKNAVAGSSESHDIDTVITTSSSSKLDVRAKYTNVIINKALTLSVDKYGPFKLMHKPISTIDNSTFYELSRGHEINVVMTPATPDKDRLAIPIRIPIRRGILNYRLLLINKSKLDLFKNITSANQLKAYTVGMHANSATSEIMKVLGYRVIEGASYDGMFKQLSLDRFDYIPRGIHEVYDELALRKGTIDNLVIEPNLALYMPMPYYIYVSPAFPRLAKRLKYGLEKMIKKKLIKQIFDEFYAEDMAKANLSKRTIIDIGNPFLSSKTPFERSELWINEFAIKQPKMPLIYQQ